jgi:hypothetical protein
MYAAAASRVTEPHRHDGVPAVKPLAVGRRLVDGALPIAEGKLVVSASAYACLLSLADQAPLDGLPLAQRTLARAKTLGYNRIGQVRTTSANQLVADFGIEHADELLRALFVFGLRQQDASDATAD